MAVFVDVINSLERCVTLVILILKICSVDFFTISNTANFDLQTSDIMCCEEILGLPLLLVLLTPRFLWLSHAAFYEVVFIYCDQWRTQFLFFDNNFVFFYFNIRGFYFWLLENLLGLL